MTGSATPQSETGADGGAAARPAVIVFDVNETLLDVKALAPAFTQQFGHPDLLPLWFGMLLRYSLEVTVTGDYHPFDRLAVNALQVVAQRHNTPVSADEAEAIVAKMTELPPHPDVPGALERLRAGGYRLITLTNSRLSAVQQQLSYAGILDYFDLALSVESVERFKPHPATYAHAAETVGHRPSDLLMVAAHDWDINGAVLAGMSTMFVNRSGADQAPHDRIPQSVSDLNELADRLGA